MFEETGDIEFDVLTQQALEVIFHSFLIILERQCAVKLPEGKCWNPSTSIREAPSFVPTTNKASESDSWIVDLLVRIMPNDGVSTMLALIMETKLLFG